MKNYTSSVNPAKSIAAIEQLLIGAKALGISKEYASGKVTAISFAIRHHADAAPVTIRLPANLDAVHRVLMKQVKRPDRNTSAKVMEQAERTAWRLLHDWVAVQLSLIEIQQVDLLQVFLPYVWNGKQTVYQAMLETRSPALGYKPKAGE